MANRFIDSELFNDEWFAELSNDAKVFWLYYITNCDHAGILKVNTRFVSFACNCNDVESLIKELGNRLVRVKQDLLWMPKFFMFQYPSWPEKKWKAADSAIEKIQKLVPDFKTYLSLAKDLPKSYGNGNGIGNGIIEVDNSGVVVKESGEKNLPPSMPNPSGPKIPAFEDVHRIFLSNGGTQEQAKAFFDKYESTGWYKNGSPIVNWVALVASFISNWQQFRKNTQQSKTEKFEQWKKQMRQQ